MACKSPFMEKIYSFLFSSLLLFSCGPTVSYIGNSYQRTDAVDVFVDESAIQKDYDIVGKGYVHFFGGKVPESIQNKAVAKAKKKGADAILVKDYYVPLSNEGLAAAVRKNNAAGRVVVAEAPKPSTEIMILFLKYK